MHYFGASLKEGLKKRLCLVVTLSLHYFFCPHSHFFEEISDILFGTAVLLIHLMTTRPLHKQTNNILINLTNYILLIQYRGVTIDNGRPKIQIPLQRADIICWNKSSTLIGLITSASELVS